MRGVETSLSSLSIDIINNINKMKNGIFQLKANDFIKGLVTAVYAAIIVTLYNVVIVNGFDFFTVDYLVLGKSVVNVGGITLLAYLFKNLTSTNKGSVLGITPDD